MIYRTFVCGVVLFVLTGCTPPAETGSARTDAAAESTPVDAGRDIPLTEQVRTTSEKDLRLINALRSFLPLLMHTYGTPGMNIAVTICPLCDGTLRIIADITDPAVIDKILSHIRQSRAPPAHARRLKTSAGPKHHNNHPA